MVTYSPTTGAVSGCNAVPSGCYPLGYVFPDKQKIEFFDGSNWVALKLNFFGATNSSGEINVVDLWYIDISANSMSANTVYPIRYKNKQTVGAGSPCLSDVWVQTTWKTL